MFEKHLVIVIMGIACVVSSLLSEKWQSDKRLHAIICVVLCLFFISQSGFRDFMHQRTDTINYWNQYEVIKKETLADQFKSFSFLATEYNGRDPGYKVFVKLTQLVWADFTFFLTITAAIICIPLWRIIYKVTPTISGIFLAACLYESLFAPFFETGIRQTIAMGLAYFALLVFLNNRRIVYVVILLLIAYLIHTSAVVFVPIFLLLKIENPKKILGWSLLLSPVFMFFASPIIAYLGTGTIFESYAVNSKDNLGTPVFTVLVLLSTLATFFYSENIIENCPDHKLLFVNMAMALALTPSSWVDSNFIRLVFYYLVFLMPLMSVIIENSAGDVRTRTVLYGLLSIAFMLL